MRELVIDISEHQGEGFDLARAKAEHGVYGVVIRCGGSYLNGEPYDDDRFEENYRRAVAAGLHVGAYFYSTARTVGEAVRDAERTHAYCEGKAFDLPVYMDVEEPDQLAIGRDALTEVVRAYLDRLEGLGHWAGLYMSLNPFEACVRSWELVGRYATWIAQYNDKLEGFALGDEVGMWQFGGDEVNFLRSPYINGVAVDQNWLAVDYPAKIAAAGLNGCGNDPVPELGQAPEPEYEGPTPDDIVAIADGELGAPDGEKYWDFVFGGGYVNGSLTPYCACFDSWVYDQARAVIPFWPRGYAFDEGDRGEIGAQWVDKHDLEKGDSLAFDWDWDGLGDHVGIVRSRHDWGCATTEGNSTGSPVSHQQRTWDNIIGGIRPVYGKSPFPPRKPKNNRDGGELTIDGDAGWNTVIDLQHLFGTVEDGVISGQCWADFDYHWGVSAVQYDEMGSQLVMAIQRMVGADDDGHWGPETSRKLQTRLASRGYDVHVDGCFGRESVRALQQAINEGRLL